MAIRYLSGINVDSNTLFVDDANNRVGIGTASPNATFTMDSSEPRFRMNISGTQQIIINHDGTTGVFRTESATPLALGTNGSEVIRITSAGNVGIGTTSPSEKLHVQGTTDVNILVRTSGVSGNAYTTYENSGDNTFAWAIGRHNAGGFYFNSSTGGTYPSGTTTTRMVIDTSGNVGIGTTSPDVYSFGGGKILTVSSTSTYSVLVLASGNANSGGISMGNQTIRRAAIDHLDGSHLAFYTNGTNSGTTVSERMRIASGGNVGIGTTSPNTKLHVEDGTAFITVRGNDASYSNAAIQLISGNATNNRALGVFHYVENSDVEWFAGLPHM